MPTEGRILTPADIAGGNPVRTLQQSTQAADEAAATTKDVQVMALSDPDVPGQLAKVDTQGSVHVRFGPLSTGVVTPVTAVTTSTTLIAASTARRRVKIFNSSTATLRLTEGQATTATLFTVEVEPKGLYESDFDGLITGLWTAANGQANVTALS